MKYDRFSAFLAAQSGQQLRMTFEEVAEAGKVKLPASAYQYAAWWENDPNHHVQAKAWTKAGFVTAEVDLDGRSVRFVRAAGRALAERGMQETTSDFVRDKPQAQNRHPLIGWMKGTFSIEPGHDLTRPVLEPEELAAWDASLDKKADRYLKGPAGKPQ